MLLESLVKSYNSGKYGNLREFVNSGKLREFRNILREFLYIRCYFF